MCPDDQSCGETRPLRPTHQSSIQGSSPLFRQLADGAHTPAAAPDPGAPPLSAVAPEEGGSDALDRLLHHDRRLASLEACLPLSRPSSSAMVRGQQDLVEDNGGTVLALAGPDYCVLAADTRLSSDYRIRSRNVTRLFEVRNEVGRALRIDRA